MQSLIYQLSRENPLWSPERIHDTPVLLQYDLWLSRANGTVVTSDLSY
ncbi:MAG: hypothetical protein ACYTAS_08050 [Planctomycetota bacterium]